MLTARLMATPGLVFAGLLLFPVACYSAAEEPIKYELAGDVMDGPNLAYAMMRTFMGEEEWQQRVAECRRRFETWGHDNHGDMGQFLNDRLIIVALSAAGGEVKEVQKGVAYLALYREFRQVPPSLVTRFLSEHKESVTELLSSFTWENASQYVKNKRWREDIARKKAMAKRDRGQAKASANPPDQTNTTAAAPDVPPQTVAVTSAAKPTVEPSVVPPATLQTMSLQWDVLAEPFMAETPLRK